MEVAVTATLSTALQIGAARRGSKAVGPCIPELPGGDTAMLTRLYTTTSAGLGKKLLFDSCSISQRVLNLGRELLTRR